MLALEAGCQKSVSNLVLMGQPSYEKKQNSDREQQQTAVTKLRLGQDASSAWFCVSACRGSLHKCRRCLCAALLLSGYVFSHADSEYFFLSPFFPLI